MSLSHFSSIPVWLSKPSQLKNVISNPFSSLQDLPTFTTLPDSSQFSSGLRQALFWRKRLSPSASSHTVIFSFLSSTGLVLPNALEVCQALKGICNTLLITEIYRPFNSRFLGISFSSPLEASKLRQHFTYFLNSVVIHVPSSSSMLHNFKLLWLPPLFPDSRIHHFISKHSILHKFTRDTTLTDTNHFTPTNSVSGTLQLHPNTDVNSLPHLIPLPAPHLGHALFILSGRSSYCLRCGCTGHIRRSCSTPRCSACRRYHLITITCSDHASIIDPAFVNFWDADDSTSDPDTSSTNLNTSPLTATSDLLSTTSDTYSFSALHTPSNASNVADSSLAAPGCDRTFSNTLAASPVITKSSPHALRSTSPHCNSDILYTSQDSSIHSHSSNLPPTPSSTSHVIVCPSDPIPQSALIFSSKFLRDEIDDMDIELRSDDDSSHASTITPCSPTEQVSPDRNSNTSSSSNVAPTATSPPHSSSASRVRLPATSISSSSSLSISTRSHKRSKLSSPDLSATSSPAHSLLTSGLTSSWADQMEDVLIKPTLSTASTTDSFCNSTLDKPSLAPNNEPPSSNSTPLSATSTDNTSLADISSISQVELQPLSLLQITALNIISSGIRPPPSSFAPSPFLRTSFCDVVCPHCLNYVYISWPPDQIVSCPSCDFKAVITRRKKLIPNPKAPFAFVSLSSIDITDPTFIEYLLYCLRLKLPLLPYITQSLT